MAPNIPKGSWGGELDVQFRQRQARQMQQLDQQHNALQLAKAKAQQEEMERIKNEHPVLAAAEDEFIDKRAAELRKKAEGVFTTSDDLAVSYMAQEDLSEDVEAFDAQPKKFESDRPKKRTLFKKRDSNFLLGHAILTIGMIEKEIDSIDDADLLAELISSAVSLQIAAIKKILRLS